MFNEEKIVEFLEKYQIGLHQYFFLTCLAKNKKELLVRYSYIVPPYEDKKRVIHDVLLDDLISKKLVIQEKVIINEKEQITYKTGRDFIAHLQEITLGVF